MSRVEDLLRWERASEDLRSAGPEAVGAVRELADRAWAGHRDRPVWQPGEVASGPLAPAEAPQPAAALARTLEEVLLDVGLNTTAPRHFGWVPGGGVAAAAVGDYLAALSNVYAGYRVPSPGAVAIERALLDWMRDLVGFPATAEGDLCAGGSPANAIALHAASPRVSRARSGARTDLAVLPEDLDCVVYLSEERHRCVDKALAFIGHGGRTRSVRVDARGRMEVGHLAALLDEDARGEGVGRPWVVVASAGTTGTGAIDPLDELAELCARRGVWLHVDAAYGGFFRLAEGARGALRGIERADSVVLDPHKGLFQPYGLGAVLVRDGRRLYAAHSADHAYIREDGHHNAALEAKVDDGSAMFRSPELSRPFRALRLWLSLQAHGVAAFRAALDHKLGLARHAWRRLGETPGVAVGPAPDLSIVPFRLVGPDAPGTAADEARQEAAVQRLRGEPGIFVTSTTFRGATWLRLAVLNLHTRLDDVDAAVDAVAAEARA